MMKTLVFVAAAAMGLTACQNDFEEQIEAKDAVVVTFVADSADSRTSVDTSGDKPAFAWAETGETFAVLEQTDALAEATAVAYAYEDGKAKITATFDNNAGKEPYQYVTVYPASGYVSAEGIEAATLTLPAEQTMVEGSYDPDADLMVSKVVTTTAQPTEAQMVQFTRLAAVAKMSFNGLGSQKVESVTFTAEGKTLAGKVTANLSDPHAFVAQEGGSNTVTVTAPEDGVEEVYFTLLPTTLEAGDSYSITVITDSKIYKKTAAIPEGKSLEFAAGMVTRFGVDLSTATVSDKWVLVRDVNDLNSGDVVTFVTKNYDYVLGVNYYTTTAGVANYAYASQTEVVKDGDLLYHNVSADNATSEDHIMQKLTLVKSGDMFNFYNGVDYEGDPFVGYLMASKNSRNMHIQTYPNADTAFDISIEDGVATIEATESDRTYNILQYYYSNKRFCCVSSSSSSYVIHIYKLAGAKETVPAANASIVTPGAEEYAVIENEEVTTPTKLNDVVFNYVGDWTVSVEDDATWLEIVYDEENNCLNYTVEANTQDKRIANVTIKTTLGERVATQTFQLLQKGAPKAVSIGEFNEMGVDVNVTYKLTGRVTDVTATSASSYEITDGTNTTIVKYLYTEGGDKVYGNDAIGLDVGDVVTVYTIVCEEDVNAGGNANYHSTYLSHYNLTATQTEEADYTEDGTATVSVARTDEQETTLTATTESEAVKSINNNNDGTFSIVFNANDGAPRVADVTFTDGLAEVVVSVIQKADESKGNTWKLVTDASELKEGDKVIIAARDYALAMSTSLKDETSTTTPRLAQAVTKIGDYLDASGDKLSNVEQLVLMNGTDGQFAFYDVDREAFLVSSTTSTSSYYLVHQNYRNSATNFGITISTDANGVVNTTIENITEEAKYEGNILGYYHSNGYFYSAPTTKQAVAIYKLAGVEEPQIPVIPAYAETADLVIEKSGIETTEAADVKFYEVGNWAISASAKVKDSEDEAEWLTLAYADGKLTYAAEANAGVMREAVVTLNATQEIAGVEKTIVIGSFNVLQKGLPKEISIAEFKQRAVDKEIEYIITGRLITIPTGISVSNIFEIEDEDGSNTAKITYFYDNDDPTDGQYVMNTVPLKVGDIVTVRTIVANKIGTGGAKLDGIEYKSIYMGHYNLTATTPEQVAYTGGTATITDIKVNIYGTISTLYPNTTIKGESEFAGFSYTDGSDSATVTFDANASDIREVEATFKSGMANLSVTVSQQNNPNVGWFLVTDASELQVGDRVIIAGKSVDGTKDYAIKTYTSNTGTSTGIAVTINANNSISNVEGVELFTLGSGHADYPGTWSFVCDTYGRYLYATSSSVKITGSLTKAGSWTIEIAADGKATLTSKVGSLASSKNTMMFNYTASNQTFSAQTASTTGKGAIYIYKYKN